MSESHIFRTVEGLLAGALRSVGDDHAPISFSRSSCALSSAAPGLAPFLENEDYRRQFMELLDTARQDASTISECLATAARILPNDDESWFREWKKTAEISESRGDLAFKVGNIATACSNWLRASNYFRTAEQYLKVGDARRTPLIGQMRANSARYMEYISARGEVVQISNFDGSLIEGYFLPAVDVTCPMPVVLCISGADQFKDEHLYRMHRYALNRGLSLLLVDLIEPAMSEPKKFSGRCDAALAIECCVDYLVGRNDVDARKIALYGVGTGASIASQAAERDMRLSAVICDGGMSGLLQRAFAVGQFARSDDFRSMARVLQNLENYASANRAHCPVLVTVAERDLTDETYGAGFFSPMDVSGSDVSLKLFADSETKVSEAEFVLDWISRRSREDTKSENLAELTCKRSKFGG